MNKAITEARCKIIWGDEPDSVKEFLKDESIPQEEADDVVRRLLDERHAAVRKNGIIKLSKAIVLLLILGALLYLMISAAKEYSAYRIHKVLGPLVGLASVALLWNLWKGIDAIFEILDPTKFKGDVGINTD